MLISFMNNQYDTVITLQKGGNIMGTIYDKYHFDTIIGCNGRNCSSMAVRIIRTASGYQLKLGKAMLNKLGITKENYGADGKGIVIGHNKYNKELYISNDESNKDNTYSLSGSENNPKVYSSALAHTVESIIGKEIAMNKTIVFPDSKIDMSEDGKEVVVIINLLKYTASPEAFVNDDTSDEVDKEELTSEEGGES